MASGPSLDITTVGIAPSYWSHVPMTIEQLNDLILSDGIFCWNVGGTCVPIMKCLLVGVVVSQTIRASDGANLFVLDDGTGFVDCLTWASNTEGDMYYLPVLDPQMASNHSQDEVKLGDVVRIHGKIQCVAIREHHSVIKEVQVILLDKVSRGDVEVEHWQACIRREEAMLRQPDDFTAAKYLQILGPKISGQVKERRMLPSESDQAEEWRVFGASCTCELAYKQELLYCHCIASFEPLDPTLQFRDALLECLLELQSKQQQAFTFCYRDLRLDEKLESVANTILLSNEKGGQPKPQIGVQLDRLFKNTFRWLRTDGVLFLANDRLDQYLLLTKKWVLEPYIRQQTRKGSSLSGSRNFIRTSDGPPYLDKVRPEKLLYVKRCLEEELK